MTLPIEGMTCDACTVHVEREPAAVPGVRGAMVSYADGRAVATVDAEEKAPDSASLVAAVAKAGYRAQVVSHT